MTDRFGWLEFDELPPSQPTAAADTTAHAAEAARAFREGAYEPALRAWSAALHADRAQPAAWAGQIRCLVRLGQPTEAHTWATRACEQFPQTPLIRSVQAYAMARAGLIDGALAASDMAIEAAERSGLGEAWLWFDRAVVLLAEGQRQTAAMCFEKSRELHGADIEWEQEIAIETLEAGDCLAALAMLGRVTAQRPQRWYAWLLMSRAARRAGQRQMAEQALHRATETGADPAVLAQEVTRVRRACWIAGQVFASDQHPAVRRLRRWRDERWLSHPLGRTAAALYDCTAPLLCRLLARNPRLQRWARHRLQNLAWRLDGRTSDHAGAACGGPRRPARWGTMP